MLDTNAAVVDESQFFEDPRKHNHSDTAPIAHVELVSDILKFNNNKQLIYNFRNTLYPERIMFVFNLTSELNRNHGVLNKHH